MFKKSLLVAVMSAALFSSQAFALATPSKSKLDGRIQYVNYSEHNVTKIKAVNGFITTITFAPVHSLQVKRYLITVQATLQHGSLQQLIIISF